MQTRQIAEADKRAILGSSLLRTGFSDAHFGLPVASASFVLFDLQVRTASGYAAPTSFIPHPFHLSITDTEALTNGAQGLWLLISQSIVGYDHLWQLFQQTITYDKKRVSYSLAHQSQVKQVGILSR
jgi:hypothetical protein